ncbi:MAG: tRNA pseudouridine(38-40) synthase TruA [Nitriliruptoraceae bacterium]
MRLRIDLAYDGGDFAGFARQTDQRTVQGDLEEVLTRLVGQPAAVTCAGRTDRGVHALAQVVHLDIDEATSRARRALADLDRFRRQLDGSLPGDVTIWSVTAVPRTFHARFSARQRIYRYRLVDDVAAADPVRRHDRWRLDDPVHVPSMRRGASHLVGEHDFASFCRRVEGRTTMRRLLTVTVTRPSPGRVDLRFAGTAFCHQQVRAMVGCLVDVGRGRRDAPWIGEVLAARDRRIAARVAPPHGLTLERVTFGSGRPSAPLKHVRR